MKKITIMLILSIMLVSGCISTSSYERNFAGVDLHFRSDLIEADKVPVYPNESSVVNLLLGPRAVRTYIAYYPNDTENPYYLAASYEIAYKLTIINKYYWNEAFPVEVLALNDSSELVPTEEEPVILLLGPSKAEDTSIKVDRYLITASGKDFYTGGRKYVDLDLAVDKILLILMELENI